MCSLSTFPTSTRRAWRDFLHRRGSEPSGPPATRPLVFKGRSDTGSVLEARRDPSGGHVVEVDRQRVERLDGPTTPISQGRPAVFRLDEIAEFDAHPRALRAL